MANAPFINIQVQNDLPPSSLVMVGSRNVVIEQDGRRTVIGTVDGFEPVVPLDVNPNATVSALMGCGFIREANRFEKIRSAMLKSEEGFANEEGF